MKKAYYYQTLASRLAKAPLSIFIALIFVCIGMPGANADPVLDKFAISTLAKLQRGSFARGEEACGYIYKINNSLNYTPIARGRAGYCDSSPDDVPKGGALLASFHNHGGFTEEYDSEVPTIEDMDMDKLDHVVGYLATPGGRVWRIKDEFTKQLCRGCVPRDPAHNDAVFLPVRLSYTRKQLIERERLDSNE